jgi:hypothetical protein
LKVNTIHADLEYLDALDFPKSENIKTWQEFRGNFLNVVLNVNKNLFSVASELISTVSKNFKDQTETVSKQIPQSVIRRVAASMVKDGITSQKAFAAAAALVSYCDKNKIAPRDVIAGELSKINSSLTVSALELLQEMEAEKSFSHQNSFEKDRNFKRSDALRNIVKENLVKMGFAIFALFFIFSGCGLKTAPKSTIIDYRPAVEYHSSDNSIPVQPPEVEKKENTDKNKTQDADNAKSK